MNHGRRNLGFSWHEAVAREESVQPRAAPVRSGDVLDKTQRLAVIEEKQSCSIEWARKLDRRIATEGWYRFVNPGTYTLISSLDARLDRHVVEAAEAHRRVADMPPREGRKPRGRPSKDGEIGGYFAVTTIDRGDVGR